MARTLVAIFAAVAISRLAEAATSTDSLLAACNETTKVIRGDGADIVGEKIDDFCRGFLQATFESMRSDKRVCEEHDDPSPYYLLSVLRTFIKDNSARSTEPATVVVGDAFRRAFPCPKTP